MSNNSIDAKMLSKMFLSGAKNLDAKKEWINELNVFPVPDGDTGTNMTMTIMSAAKEVSGLGDNASMEAIYKTDLKRRLLFFPDRNSVGICVVEMTVRTKDLIRFETYVAKAPYSLVRI